MWKMEIVMLIEVNSEWWNGCVIIVLFFLLYHLTCMYWTCTLYQTHTAHFFVHLYFLTYLDYTIIQFCFCKEKKIIKYYCKISLSDSAVMAFEWYTSHHVSCKSGLGVDSSVSQYMLWGWLIVNSRLFTTHFVELMQSLIPMQIFHSQF